MARLATYTMAELRDGDCLKHTYYLESALEEQHRKQYRIDIILKQPGEVTASSHAPRRWNAQCARANPRRVL